MSGMAIIAPHRPARLAARRRSRCWKCDSQMKKWQQPSWFCRKCCHVVTYLAEEGE